MTRPLVALALCTASACAHAPEATGITDPYEAANRRVHAFNKGLDSALSGAGGGSDVSVPDEIAIPVNNFADNVALPGIVVNNLLQADIGAAGINVMRFVVNTTAGIGGLFDPGDAIGLTAQETDFGETLHVWGVGEGAYLELPVLGPSSERDLAGKIVDAIINPLPRIGTDPQQDYATIATIASKALTRAQFGDSVDDVLHGSADSYAQTRLMYLQHRRYELREETDQAAADAAAIDPYAELGQ